MLYPAFKQTFVFSPPLGRFKMSFLLSARQDEYCVIPAIHLCRLYPTSWIPWSEVLTVTPQYRLKGRVKSICRCLGCGCKTKRCVIWPSSSDEDFYLMLPNMHISHHYSRRVCVCGVGGVFLDACTTLYWSCVDMDFYFCASHYHYYLLVL